MRPNTRCWMDAGLGRRRRSGSPQLTGPAGRDPTAPTIGSLVCGSDRKPGKGTEMSAPRNILRIVLLTAAAGLLAVAASVLREKKATVDPTSAVGGQISG